MKSLKITLLITLFVACLTSCTKQELTEDDIQRNSRREMVAPITGGDADE